MKVSYRTDLYANYMLIEIPQEADVNKYSFKMLEKNQIKGVLPCKIRMEDGKGYLYVDITNKKNLENLYEGKEMQLEDMLYTFQNLLPVLEELRNYLLTEEMVCFDPEYIYMDEEEESFYVVVLPWREEQQNFHKLAEFFLEKINHKDENGVNAAYHFYRQQSKHSFSLYQFLPILEKENVLKRQKKSREEESYVLPATEAAMEPESDLEEEVMVKDKKGGVNGQFKVVFLILTFLLAAVSWLAAVPYTIKISCIACSVLSFLLFLYYLLFPKKEVSVKEKETCKEEEWESAETVFFDPEDEEEWKIQWKERGRTKQKSLKEFPCKVGKMKEEADIVIQDMSVSRLHCQFIKKEGQIYIMDLNSTNGTCLNGLPVKNNEIMEIEKNDEILIGKVSLLVV